MRGCLKKAVVLSQDECVVVTEFEPDKFSYATAGIMHWQRKMTCSCPASQTRIQPDQDVVDHHN